MVGQLSIIQVCALEAQGLAACPATQVPTAFLFATTVTAFMLGTLPRPKPNRRRDLPFTCPKLVQSDMKPKMERGPFLSSLRKLSTALHLVQLVNSCSYLKALQLMYVTTGLNEAQTLIGLAQEKPRIQRKKSDIHPDAVSIQCE